MSMEIAKSYGNAAEATVSNYLRNLTTGQIIMGLIILYMVLCMAAPDIVGQAALFNADSSTTDTTAGYGGSTNLP